MRTSLQNFQSSTNLLRQVVDIIFKATSLEEEVRLRNETQQSAATVLLTGYFEAFLKDVVRAYINLLSGKQIPFKNLPDKIRQIHWEEGGRVLQEIAKRTKRGSSLPFETDPIDIVKRLHSASLGDGSPYTILWEAFANTRESPKSDVVKDILQDLGIKTVWISIEQKTGGSALASVLNDLITDRNECAHTGKNKNVPSPPRLLDYIDALNKISEGIVVLLEEELAKF